EKEGTSSPHLSADQANRLVTLVLERYRAELKQQPVRAVVHKTSTFWPAEREGFIDALKNQVARFDLLSVIRDDQVRLLTEYKFPPLRGTRFQVGDLDFLYTNGFIAALGEFHGSHVPAPIRISDHIGQDTSREMLLKEVLILSKMNWNSARLGGG